MTLEIASLAIGLREGSGENAVSERLHAMAREHLRYVWRLLRRIGLPERDADDVTQKVFLIAAQKLDVIQPGSERSFLYKTAIYTASKFRRGERRRREDLMGDIEMVDDPDLDELLDRRRAREMLDGIIAAMPMDLRVVFVLFEIEGISTAEIAEVVGIPAGTAASRLRRAREDFGARTARFEARRVASGGRR